MKLRILDMVNETRLALSQCPVQNVTVFVDRAQVTRTCAFLPQAGGEHALIITGLTQSAETDSLRLKVITRGEVKGDEKEQKKGPEVVIVEVSLDTHHRPKDNAQQSEREKVARESLKAAEKKEAALAAELGRVRQQDELIQSYIRTMLTSTGSDNNPPAVGANLETATQLLAFHASRAAENDAKKANIEQALAEVGKEKSAATAELGQVSRSTREPESSMSRDITALLQIPDGVQEVVLSVQYLVRDALWSPSYDLRYDSRSQGGLPNNLIVTYHGVVKQTTGEDWNDIILSLSTAAPARGGAPPMPPTRIAQLRTGYQARSYAPSVSSYSNTRVPQQAMMLQAEMGRRYSTTALEADFHDEPEVTAPGPSVVVKEGGSNATFVIDRKSTIASDSKEHKVTIAMIVLSPEMRFFATPQLEQQAYLQARSVNSSPYPFLPSETASVFIDGSFISKTKLELTAPGETFNLFLGVDAGVKVEHRVLKNTTTKGKEGKMMVSKKEPSKKIVEYRTMLHNTKAVAIEITVVELCPRTSDERVVVEVLQPTGLTVGGNDTPASGESQLKVGGVMQNKVTNNVVFARKLNPGEKMELPFCYSISWPHDAGEVDVV
jgi:uncharacterized protein (TIGR02231 family)